MFSAGVFIAVLWNVWFGYGCLRLTDRFSALLGTRVSVARTRLTRAAILIGVVFEMVAMITPLLVRVELVLLPDNVLYGLQVVESLGRGSLLAWVISVHGMANRLARRQTDRSQTAASFA